MAAADLPTNLPPVVPPQQPNEAQIGDEVHWVERMWGSMKDYPEYDEVTRLGREFRRSDSPPDSDEEE